MFHRNLRRTEYNSSTKCFKNIEHKRRKLMKLTKYINLIIILLKKLKLFLNYVKIITHLKSTKCL